MAYDFARFVEFVRPWIGQAAIQPHAGLQPLITFDGRIGLQPRVADVQQLRPIGIGFHGPQIFVINAQNEFCPRARRIGNEIEPFRIPAMIRVFGNAQEGLGHAAPCVGDGPQMPDIGFLGLQENGAIRGIDSTAARFTSVWPRMPQAPRFWIASSSRTEAQPLWLLSLNAARLHIAIASE